MTVICRRLQAGLALSLFVLLLVGCSGKSSSTTTTPQPQISSISVGPDQTLSYPSSLSNIPDEHTTFIPPGVATSLAANEYLVFASSKTTGSTGGAVALQ